MAKVPKEVVEESYLLKSTFFFRKLHELEYVGITSKITRAIERLDDELDWSRRKDIGINEGAWKTLDKQGISPAKVFVHPNFLRSYPSLLKYYRCLAMLPQKGLQRLCGLGNVKQIEDEDKDIPESKLQGTVTVLNQFLSTVIDINGWYEDEAIKAMVYSTAGTTIDGSWRNAIGEEGERVIKEILVKSLRENSEISFYISKNGDKIDESNFDPSERIDELRTIILKNKFSIIFRSEPDGTIQSPTGEVTGGIEVKAGLDPAGALERLGAMFKSFENVKQTYPKAKTILVASCLTDEVEARIRESQSVDFTFILTDITLDKRSAEAKFVNKVREMCRLIGKRM